MAKDSDHHARVKLATELLLGTPRSDPKGYYHLKRRYPEGRRELKARKALADELRTEAPDGYFTHLLADMIDPRVKSRAIDKQSVKFIPARGGRRSSGRLDLKICEFMHKKKRRGGVDAAAVLAKEHFKISETRVWQAWKSMLAKPKTNTRI
jgi:hypothetical protein